MPSESFDVIVAGLGSMGASTCYELSKRGYRVLGLEQQQNTPHEMGAHGGQSRIIRKAYFEHSDYIPLLDKAYEGWHQLESITGEQVFHPCGLLYYGPSAHPIIQGVKQAAHDFKIPLQAVTDQKLLSSFVLKEGHEAWLEPAAGFLLPEKAIRLFLQEAGHAGAILQTGEKIINWKKRGDEMEVLTTKQTYYSKRLIITAGPWAAQLIHELAVPLTVTRQIILWVETDQLHQFSPSHFPCWLIAASEGNGAWYGFPSLDTSVCPGPQGLKLALHHPADSTHADTVNRIIAEDEIQAIQHAALKYFKPAGNKVLAAKTCLYTNSPDEHFIVDHLPGYAGAVTIACGFSGHGFKFVPVIGRILADLAMDGKTDLPAGFLGLQRFKGS